MPNYSNRIVGGRPSDMKQLTIKCKHFAVLLKSYAQWLQTMGYAKQTVATFPIHLREFFHYLEQRNVFRVKDIRQRHYDGFISHLQIRKNERLKSNGLSASMINKVIQSINTFAKYINQNGRFTLDLKPKYLQNTQNVPTILTQTDIKKLYESTFEPHRLNSKAIGQRDRAILAIFMAVAFRKSEGSALNITDIDLQKRLLFVRKGKEINNVMYQLPTKLRKI